MAGSEEKVKNRRSETETQWKVTLPHGVTEINLLMINVFV